MTSMSLENMRVLVVHRHSTIYDGRALRGGGFNLQSNLYVWLCEVVGANNMVRVP